jgi:hypothetical protein
MTHEDALRYAAQQMIDIGGSFAACIGEAYFCADSTNRARLLDAFGHLFDKYKPLPLGETQ